MNRFAFAVAGLFVALAVIVRPVHGDSSPPSTAVPTPAVTPTSTLPSADDLLAASTRAQMEKGSAHFAASIRMVVPKFERMVQTSYGDTSFRDQRMHEHDTVQDTPLDRHPASTTRTLHESIFVPPFLADRSAHGTWQCSNLTGMTGGSDSLAGVLTAGAQVSASLADPPMKTIQGIPTWDVHQTITLPGLTPRDQPIEEDDYIALSDHTTVRTTFTGTMLLPVYGSRGNSQSVAMRETGVQDFSRYGQSIAITLPRVCASTSAQKARLLLAPALRPALTLRLLLGGLSRMQSIGPATR